MRLMGSSPRMRGTRGAFARPKQNGGIIPAYAGNTLFESISADPGRDHPRVCGEHQFSNVHGRQQRGSSPRMRGTQTPLCDTDTLEGIIPAYAGNTFAQWIDQTKNRDHPRVCGEHLLSRLTRFTVSGSSPRMRGTRARQAAVARERGIIPAYAGNTVI